MTAKGTFTDTTVASGLARPATATQAAVWTDIDNDGFLDLFVGSEDAPAQLFLNKRDGTFQDIGLRAGIGRTSFTKSVAAADYDNDGWPDLYASSLNGRGALYRNNHDRTFTDVTEQAGTPGSGRAFGSWFFDYDNDGWQDLFVTSYFTSVDETVRTYLGLPHAATTLKLYRNRGNGTFADVTQAAGLEKVFMPMGANFGDVDNDGFLDIYLGTGNPSYATLVPSVLLRNKDGASFVDITASSGTGELHKGHGVAFADLDDDGDSDLVFEVGGAVPGDAHALRLFENPGHGNDWLALTLDGVTTNRVAIGARVTVTVQTASGTRRVIQRVVGGGGHFGVSPLRVHVGLGRDARGVDVDVWWPTSRSRQHFTGVPKNRVFRIREHAATYTSPDRPATPPAARHAMAGLVVEVDAAHKRVVVSHDAVPGLMEAMTMPFEVRDAAQLAGLVPGAIVTFTLVMDGPATYVEQVRIREYRTAEQDPLTARRLAILTEIAGGQSGTGALPVGGRMPDFALIDHRGRPVTLSQFKGRLVAVNFIYTSCALPQFCFRIANHFGVLQKRFVDRLGTDLVLLTVTFDPARDRPEVLADYASQWQIRADGWRFLTGEVAEVRRVGALFGVQAFQEEGLMNHSSRTAIIDRRGVLAASIEGNRFTATQLGDLVDTLLKR
jgi:cytochrome oxidase Cu insertion factor (SCO1/SenC/PrrC family)/Cu/Ag efflux protein CusF